MIPLTVWVNFICHNLEEKRLADTQAIEYSSCLFGSVHAVGWKNSTNESRNKGKNFEIIFAISKAHRLHLASWYSSREYSDSVL